MLYAQLSETDRYYNEDLRHCDGVGISVSYSIGATCGITGPVTSVLARP
jgi:hypothetical protein